jgi:uncharacterized protein GlcG (DUF336 family)
MSFISLDQANTIIAGALAKGRELGLRPLSVGVLDAGGHLLAFQRSDGSANLRLEIVMAKAGGALGMGLSSRRIGEMAVERPHFIASLGMIAPHGMAPVAGGVIVVDDSGRAIGAVGVSGDTSDNDEVCALAGIAGVGLKAQG